VSSRPNENIGDDPAFKDCKIAEPLPRSQMQLRPQIPTTRESFRASTDAQLQGLRAIPAARFLLGTKRDLNDPKIVCQSFARRFEVSLFACPAVENASRCFDAGRARNSRVRATKRSAQPGVTSRCVMQPLNVHADIATSREGDDQKLSRVRRLKQRPD
jgi:hypothetical protein